MNPSGSPLWKSEFTIAETKGLHHGGADRKCSCGIHHVPSPAPPRDRVPTTGATIRIERPSGKVFQLDFLFVLEVRRQRFNLSEFDRVSLSRALRRDASDRRWQEEGCRLPS
jgi:hypothetical protein